MKYYCEACERLVPPAAFRMEDGLLVLKCSRCKVEMRGAIEQDEVPAPSSRSTSSSSVPQTSAPKTAGDEVIALGRDDAEPDPGENQPTRRMPIPAQLLQSIEDEARENRRKKDREKERERDREREKERDGGRERPRDKAPVPVLESAADKASEPVKVAEFIKSGPPTKPSEAGGSNLMVLRLSEVPSSRATPEPAPAPAPARTATPMESPRAPSPALRVVREGNGGVPVSPDDAFMPPAGFCPKCIGLRKEGSQVCPFCGLDFTRFRQDDFRPSPMVASTWLGVQELWESKGAHDKVLALASERGELPSLGRLYRVRLARQPDDPMALRGREEVLRLAAAGSMMLATPPPDKGAKARAAVMSAFLFALVVLLAAMGWRAWKSFKGIQ